MPIHPTRIAARARLEAMLGAPATAEADAEIRATLLEANEREISPEELAGYADSLRVAAIPIDWSKVAAEDAERLRSSVIDTCGTGGDSCGTFNISTAAAILAAACGVPIAKHGNRSATSKCGSADVLAALGIPMQDAAHAAAALRDDNFAFLFAPAFHPGMARVSAIRRSLGVRTFFNLLGPLANPAGARRQVIGTYSPEAVSLLARTLALLGAEHVFVVHGLPAAEMGGLDEITLTGPTFVAEVRDGAVREMTLTPEDFGLPAHAGANAYAGGDAAESARILTGILRGELQGAPREVVLANTAAVLRVAGLAESWKDGVAQAAEAVQTGAAGRKLEQLSQPSSRN
jgi:anthranilate phosphoribosyltransferase